MVEEHTYRDADEGVRKDNFRAMWVFEEATYSFTRHRIRDNELVYRESGEYSVEEDGKGWLLIVRVFSSSVEKYENQAYSASIERKGNWLIINSYIFYPP